jgi:hypothetical protein
MQSARSVRSVAGLALVATLLAAWSVWFVCARVAVYVTSDAARLEVDREVLPEGQLRLVATFEPASTLGRVRPGQRARVRFHGLPWMPYGTASAHVVTVTSQVGDSEIRVELQLESNGQHAIPYQPGLTAVVDVEVEMVSPATLVLRSAGVWTDEHASDPALAMVKGR